jgi:hypothetical protein
MTQIDKAAKAQLTLDSFDHVAGLVAARRDLADMLAHQRWVPADLLAGVPEAIRGRLTGQRLKIDVERVGEAAIREIDRELAQYGFVFRPPAG